MFEIFGQGSLSDFLGDAVVYRNLAPVDRRLPGLEQLREPIGLPPSGIPRKVEPAYARVVVEILRAANRLLTDSHDPVSVILIGDTEHNDGSAFRNICDVLACPGGAFICDEGSDPPRLEATTDLDRRVLYTANRWRLIDRFEDELARLGIEIGRDTAVIVDIDKTALGARGRNHRPIDAARVAAGMRTANEVLGERADRDLLMAAYDRFNQPKFHPFTTDNQDYLAYIALMVGGGWSSPDVLADEVAAGSIPSFEHLLERVADSLDALPPALRTIHEDVLTAFAAGDPTPFKKFRRAEFRETVERMLPSADPPPIAELLENRITITDEVRRKTLEWRERGALILGLSDKPDEASCPGGESHASDVQPLHRTPAWVVGENEG